jgi:hypothetical protein
MEQEKENEEPGKWLLLDTDRMTVVLPFSPTS